MSVEAGWDAWTSLDPGHYRLFVGDPPREVPQVERFQIPESETPAPSTVNKIDLPGADAAARASLWEMARTLHTDMEEMFDLEQLVLTLKYVEAMPFHERANVLHYAREKL